MDFRKATFKIYDRNRFQGTGFRLNNSNIVFTAKHVMKGCNKVSVRAHYCKNANQKFLVHSVYGHPTADLVALFLEGEGWEGSESFPLHCSNGLPSLGTDICMYGYTTIKLDGDPQDRFLKGYIQRTHFEDWKYGKFWAFEGSFNSTAGLSGSPIFLDNESKDVVGLLWGSDLAAYKSCHRYAQAVYLPALSDWIDEMVEKEPYVVESIRNRVDYLKRFETEEG